MKIILDEQRFEISIERLCREIIENYGDLTDLCLIGLQKGGVYLADRIHKRLGELIPGAAIPLGKLDVTFYRDDFRIRKMPLTANETRIDFLVDGKRVLLIDDVLYTGRTIASAFTAIQHYGRPQDVALLVMVNRRFNRHLPIFPNYTGITIDGLNESYVRVDWAEVMGKDQILFLEKETEKKE